MNFKTYLDEMTIRAGNLRHGIEPSRVRYEPMIIKDGECIGDLKSLDNEYKIYTSKFDGEIQFAIYDSDILVTLFNGKYKKYPNISKCFYLEQMITKEKYAGQHLSAKLLVFLKTREKIPVVFSGIHSTDTVHNIRKIARTVPMLKISWFNIMNGEIDEFNVEQDDGDTKHAKPYPMTNWRIMVEAIKEDIVDDNGNKIFNHFLKESKGYDPTQDYNIWIKNEI